ncbi:MAG: VOC family protein, partial [Pseudomonadota bacterium]|nr:VOC family protein [Pseudomonadota bacterium]
MIRISEIDHVVLRVIDMEAMQRFYCDVLGCHQERQQL